MVRNMEYTSDSRPLPDLTEKLGVLDDEAVDGRGCFLLDVDCIIVWTLSCQRQKTGINVCRLTVAVTSLSFMQYGRSKLVLTFLICSAVLFLT